MIQLAPQLKIMLAVVPIDFRKGIDALAALCRNQLNQDPFCGTLFVFRNRRGTAVKLLVFDGTGYWLCLKRFSRGKLAWWPTSSNEPLQPLQAQQLGVLLAQGNPLRASFPEDWRKVV
jgi:transposase